MILFVMFFVTLSLFLYENIWLKKKETMQQGYVLVAKENIHPGETFSKENVGLLPVPKKSILPSYVTNFEELKGKQAKEIILKEEVITKGRAGKVGKSEDAFSVLLQMSEQAAVKKGDMVNVYVRTSQADPNKKERMIYQTYVIAEKKVVEDVIYKKSASGKEMPVIESVLLSMSERQALDYYLAKNMTEVKAKVFIVPYRDVLAKETSEQIPSFSSHFKVEEKSSLSKDGSVTVER